MKQMTKYGHVAPLKPQHCPYSPNPIKYGKDNQAPSLLDDSPLLDAAGKKRVQQIVGSFLYYARAVDPTILMALSEISSQQSAPTENTMKRVNQFLDYMWTHPDAIIRYRASDMILNVHSNASYLSAPKARSRAGGYFFLGSVPRDGDPIKLNSGNSCHVHHPQAGCCFRSRSRTRGTLPQCARSKSNSTYPCRTQTSTTTHTNTHRQYNNGRHRKQHHQTTTI